MKFILRLVASILLTTAFNAKAALVSASNEGTFLTAVAAYSVLSEGFESTDWSATRGSGTPGSVESQGVAWDASDNLRTINAGAFPRSGYGVFDSPGDPDSIEVSSAQTGRTLHGVGGWFLGTTASLIDVYVDGVLESFFSISGSHSFYGISDVDGFSSVRFQARSGQWGADDFSVAFADSVIPVPPSLLLLGIGITALAYRRRSQG